VFEWDSGKARANLAKHGVSFAAARLVFDDAFAVCRVDLASDPAEIRYMAIGLANGRILAVAYTERGERIRIISARKATKHEQRDYHNSRSAE
jgi:uncharacterized DUF497 family protein